jgi:parvulin-like peptidyl-prolyl isomerase
MQLDSVVTTVKGRKILVGDVVAQLKLKGMFRSAIYELIEQRVVELMLEELGLSVPEKEVEKRIRTTRAALGIESPGNFEKYLNFYGITEVQWCQNIRNETSREFLKNQLVTAKRISDYFKKDSTRFASVSIARIACRSREEAEQVVQAATSNRLDFVELARTHSADESTRQTGGFLGNVKHGMLPPEVDRLVFACKENEVIGPFCENTLWTVYKVYSVNTPKLTDALRNVIRDHLFSEWLREQACSVPA